MASDIEARVGGRCLLPSISSLVMGSRDVTIDTGSVKGAPLHVLDHNESRPKIENTIHMDKDAARSVCDLENVSDPVSVAEREKERRREKNREYGRRFRETQKQKLNEMSDQINDKQEEIDRTRMKILEQETRLRRHGMKTDLSALGDIVELGQIEERPAKRECHERRNRHLLAENTLLSHSLCRRSGTDAYDPAEVLLCLFTLNPNGTILTTKVTARVGYGPENNFVGKEIWSALHPHDQLCLKILISHSSREPVPGQVLSIAYRRRLDVASSVRYVRVHASIQPILDANQQVDGFALAEFLER
mmetsp:Transcript_6517/g.19784  ORF Transcript_6517/g.19784 Transcript_6517/m.19784 type:complete len:305 (+) Transcript_6517:454-1368(+)|eukprot:CAMPEP_0198732536 /NCGR_PEP_ID=MMETSP1475-20131203/36516_1 /TAXON_ID= ORGANISM="Unidentified sp., Strain CCMP1999" /NCGR_SAMPLE_ID=MMETSP1475 /ASSEMBLY_ACC=CAM_ASM_001111 /LENGTH=304 /DNA_ID=CAMNT_0044495673 /DNA_START=440 /DNA_END=1354 /DNA_ORIENTATION=+